MNATRALTDRASVIQWYAEHLLEMMARPDLTLPFEKCPRVFLGSPTMDPEGKTTERTCGLLAGHFDQHLWIDWDKLLEKP